MSFPLQVNREKLSRETLSETDTDETLENIH